MVLLVEILHAHAILLRDGVHAFSRLNHVWTSLVLLRRLLALLLQIDDVALLQHVVLVALVVSGQFSPADAHFLAQCLEGISLAGIEIVVVVVGNPISQFSAIFSCDYGVTATRLHCNGDAITV